MAIIFSPDENRAALDELILANRAELAKLRWVHQLHRDLLNSPQDVVSGIEAQAIKTAQAVEWLMEQRDALPASKDIQK